MKLRIGSFNNPEDAKAWHDIMLHKAKQMKNSQEFLDTFESRYEEAFELPKKPLKLPNDFTQVAKSRNSDAPSK